MVIQHFNPIYTVLIVNKLLLFLVTFLQIEGDEGVK